MRSADAEPNTGEILRIEQTIILVRVVEVKGSVAATAARLSQFCRDL
jgi:hypothetical protein